ncbi:DEAD/DEAH box helicase [Pelosinus sp. sgz500959]|uniref:DEAD/DEAH box helicase n=1 Tax=Pelosinus sp. sgz500959 TaxID=3242472 RepID=UPI00366CD50B
MTESFDTLGLSGPLVAGLHAAGIDVPTGIQTQVIPLALLGKDIIGQSATGTGKTLAFLLPIFQRIDTTKREMQAMILAPTHELAIQILRQVEVLAKNSGLPVTSTSIIGNVNIARQIDKLKERPHILVGSSGRILELIQKKKITSQTIKTIVIDEADRLFDERNVDSVKAVIKTTLKDRQIMLFSATITPETLVQAQKIMHEPEVLTIEGQVGDMPDITHLYFMAEQRDKIEMLRKIVALIHGERVLIFINKSEEIETTAAKLEYHGLKAAGIHGSSFKGDRKKSLEDFRKGKVQLLVASDVAARGLDITGVNYVFNLDMPEDPQVYLHRVGRTGRAGKSGIAISIIDKPELPVIHKYEKLLNLKIAAKYMANGKILDKVTKADPAKASEKVRPKNMNKIKAKPAQAKTNKN